MNIPQNFSNNQFGSETKPSSINKIYKFLFGTKKRVGFSILAIVIVVFLTWTLISKTSGEIAALSLSPSTASVTAGTDFNLNMIVDTKGNNVVVVKGVVTYSPSEFSLQSWSTANSVFTSGNACIFNSKPCEIITEDAANGKIIITEVKPKPGVNTVAGQLATLTFRAKKALTSTVPNIKVQYVAFGDYSDSDVILDDGFGTDILSAVSNTTVAASLPVPTGLSAVAASATGVNLSWSVPLVNVGVTGYKIFRNNVQVGTSATNAYADTKLTPLTAYQYKISAYDAGGNNSTQTAAVSATTLADTTKPSVPTNLASSNIGMDKLNLSWTAATDDVSVTGYNIYRNGTKIGSAAAATYQDTNLKPETSYTYTVSAYDAAGNQSAQTAGLIAKTAVDTQAPTVPNNVTAQAVSMTQINLSWTASTDNVGVTGYKIFRNNVQVGTATTTTYQDTGLTVATTYSYQVLAYDAKNNASAKTATVTATTNSDTQKPTVPTNLTGTAASMNQINLSWTASTDNIGVSGYKIFRNSVQVGTSATTTYQDTGLTKLTAYNYTVSAYDAAGNQSLPTAQITVTTLADTQKPTVPGGLAGTALSMTEIQLSWNASTDNIAVTGYRLYRGGIMIKDLNALTHKDINLTAGTAYNYTVSAYDADGNESAQSPAVKVTTLFKKYTLTDFTTLSADWLQTKSSPADVDKDGTINSKDLGIMMSNWQ